MTTRGGPPIVDVMADELDDDTLAFAEQMFDLARGGQTEQLVAYLDAGLPVNLTNAKGDTLLILAAYHARLDVVRVLLERGADVHRVNDRGQNALASATFKQEPEIIKLLLAAGADPDQGNPSARATTQFFNLPEIAALFDEPRQPQ